MEHMFFVISSLFLSILVTSFSIGIIKVMCFSVFSPKQVKCFLNSFANSFMSYNHNLIHYEKHEEFFQVHYILNHICYAQDLYVPLYNDNDLQLYNIFIFHIFIFRFFFTNITDFCISYDSGCFFDNFCFFFLNVIIFIVCFLKDFSKLFHTIFSSVHHAYFLCF